MLLVAETHYPRSRDNWVNPGVIQTLEKRNLMLTSALQWKQELLRSAARLEKKTTQKRWTDQTAFIVERHVMVVSVTVEN